MAQDRRAVDDPALAFRQVVHQPELERREVGPGARRGRAGAAPRQGSSCRRRGARRRSGSTASRQSTPARSRAARRSKGGRRARFWGSPGTELKPSGATVGCRGSRCEHDRVDAAKVRTQLHEPALHVQPAGQHEPGSRSAVVAGHPAPGWSSTRWPAGAGSRRRCSQQRRATGSVSSSPWLSRSSSARTWNPATAPWRSRMIAEGAGLPSPPHVEDRDRRGSPRSDDRGDGRPVGGTGGLGR